MEHFAIITRECVCVCVRGHVCVCVSAERAGFYCSSAEELRVFYGLGGGKTKANKKIDRRKQATI